MKNEISSAKLAFMLGKVLQVSKDAGQAIMKIYGTDDFGVVTKEDNSPLTLADLAAHQVIVEGLNRMEPRFPILSEEDAKIPFSDRQNRQRYWLVDPLDGTKEFVKRNGEFTVNIALIENGVPILGVVYAPVLDVSYYAAQGIGAYKRVGNAEAEVIQAQSQSAGASIKVVASRSHSDQRTTDLLQKLGDCECVSMGSSLKLCLVAEGAAHFYPRLAPTSEWDTAAAHAVVLEAGGVVCDVNRNPLVYNKENLLNPEFLVFAKSNSDLLSRMGCLS